jgi:O-antigen/teichoic acid export membrane protein
LTARAPRTRRRVIAALAVYASSALGIAGSLVVFRVLGPTDAGRFAIVIGGVQFLSLLTEITCDEALVKFGFRYSAREDWARFHRLVRVAFAFELTTAMLSAGLIVALAPFASSIFQNAPGLTTPLLIAALVPLLQSMESIGAQILILRGRYDLRSLFLVYSMALRLIGLAIGVQHGVTAAVVGLLAAQIVTTLSIVGVGVVALGRFPAAEPAPLGDDRRPFLQFVLKSSLDSALDSLRVWLAPLLLGVVRSPTEVGLFRGAQTPQQGFAVLSSPVRLILLTEQTRDWEEGKREAVVRGVRRYVIGATLLMAVILPPAEWFAPWLVRLVLGSEYAPATDAVRLILLAAALQFVFGWTMSFAVTIGRPGLRILAHAVEVAVLLPLLVLFGDMWGVTGAGAATLVGVCAYAAVWTVLAFRLRAEYLGTVGSLHVDER